ncbi:MAG: HXXEE domain-containing protein [Bacteroidetes bacterium]|nr:HXXEE domain-containing protein [Bacteroidota bacterium]
MDFFRDIWYDFGAVLLILVLIYVYIFFDQISAFQLLMWLNLASLFCHQLEEYRIGGTFPGMINRKVFKSKMPDRYPLNTNTAFLINVVEGWLLYFLAAIFAEKAPWLCIIALMISLGNIIAHSLFFNIKGKTFYNAGLITCWILFAPCIYFFFKITVGTNLISLQNYLVGITLGIVINIFGVFKMIQWLADKDSKYIFPQRNLLPQDRGK